MNFGLYPQIRLFIGKTHEEAVEQANRFITSIPPAVRHLTQMRMVADWSAVEVVYYVQGRGSQ